MKSEATEKPADGNQYIDSLKGDWNTLYVAGSLALFASFALGAALVSANALTAQGDIVPSLTVERDQLAGVFTALGKIIPDLRWTIKDIWTSGNRIVVRGEAIGTPTGELFGVKPTGKSFKTISIDMFTVRDGKLATAYHVENWMAAMEQIK
jgi:predicted ester cyclase